MRNVFRWLNRYKSIFFLTLAGFLFLMAQTAFWVNQTIFDQKTFTEIVHSTITTEENRQSIATAVVNGALEDRPVAKRIIGDRASQLIAGLLGTDQAQQLYSAVINKTYTYLTSSDQQDIDIDLLAIKTPLTAIVSLAETLGREVQIDPSNIPDSIVLIESDSVPDFYNYSQKLLWAGPILWLSSLGLLSGYIYRGRRVYAKRVYIVGIVIIITSLVGLLIGPLVTPPVVSMVPAVNLRGVVGDLLSALLQPFVQQLIYTILITLGVLVIFRLRFVIAGQVKNISAKLSKSNQAEEPKPIKKSPRNTTKKSKRS